MTAASMRGWAQGTAIAAGLNNRALQADNAELLRICDDWKVAYDDVRKDWDPIAPYSTRIENGVKEKIEDPKNIRTDIFLQMDIPKVWVREENSVIPLNEKRMHNLKLLSWVEWWMETLNRHNTDVAIGERVESLSEQMDNEKAHGGIKSETSDQAVQYMKQMGQYLKMSKMQADPNAWVKERVDFYADLYTKGIMKFRPDEPAIPLHSTIRNISEYRNFNARMVEYEKQYVEAFDPFVHNFLGIGDMSLRENKELTMRPDANEDAKVRSKYGHLKSSHDMTHPG